MPSSSVPYRNRYWRYARRSWEQMSCGGETSRDDHSDLAGCVVGLWRYVSSIFWFHRRPCQFPIRNGGEPERGESGTQQGSTIPSPPFPLSPCAPFAYPPRCSRRHSKSLFHPSVSPCNGRSPAGLTVQIPPHPVPGLRVVASRFHHRLSSPPARCRRQSGRQQFRPSVRAMGCRWRGTRVRPE